MVGERNSVVHVEGRVIDVVELIAKDKLWIFSWGKFDCLVQTKGRKTGGCLV